MLELKAEFRSACEEEDARCWMCGLEIDYSIPPELSWKDPAFQLDHFFPVSKYPELQEDPGNFRASHARCNRDRGDGPPRPPLGVLSESFY
ncbi:hypothetical protein B0T42_10020 [Rathayibacter sp. VKM Ac-2630]|nr:hypothetical protein B0T42_10020 [Rathayibacter sp. VKM Ac-2630]